STSPPTTYIIAGETVGGFDPTNKNYSAIGMGVWLETNTFITHACGATGNACNTTGSGLTSNQQRLQDLKIPHVEVGQTNLSGSLVSGSDYVSVVMNGVKFFATASGQKPSIWATNTVSGSYSMATAGQINGQPITNSVNSFTISNGAPSNPLTATFQFNLWDTAYSRWVGSITQGSGNLPGGSYTGPINFNGVATGTFGSGSLTNGSAAGIVK
ncbi:MAG: hypothetical protein N3A62_03305, partial [Thermodesulfovibrionales bacterium]|nr:hypothetical protein [Thermodesulfovibrionales bacterium]